MHDSIADTRTMSRLELLIHTNTKELINLSERLSTEREPDVLMRIHKNMAIKRKFLDRLRSQQRERR